MRLILIFLLKIRLVLPVELALSSVMAAGFVRERFVLMRVAYVSAFRVEG